MYFPDTSQQDFFRELDDENYRDKLINQAFRLRNKDIGYRMKKK
jgi:hypothetical protein